MWNTKKVLKRTKIAYFPGCFVVVENLIVRTEVERGYGQTDKKYTERSLKPFKQKKKRILKIWRKLKGVHGTDGQTDGQKIYKK